jgi:hypothetical protein
MKTLPMSKKKRNLIFLAWWFLACGVGASYLIYFPTHKFDSLLGGISLLTSIYMFVVCNNKANKME